MDTDPAPDLARLGELPEKAGQVLIRLAELPPAALLDESALATALGVSRRTVQRMVIRGEVQPGVQLGGRPVWIAGRVCTWLARRAEEAEREAIGQAAKFRRLRA